MPRELTGDDWLGILGIEAASVSAPSLRRWALLVRMAAVGERGAECPTFDVRRWLKPTGVGADIGGARCLAISHRSASLAGTGPPGQHGSVCRPGRRWHDARCEHRVRRSPGATWPVRGRVQSARAGFRSLSLWLGAARKHGAHEPRRAPSMVAVRSEARACRGESLSAAGGRHPMPNVTFRRSTPRGPRPDREKSASSCRRSSGPGRSARRRARGR